MHPHRTFLLYEDEEWTYEEFDLFVNRIARTLKKLGLKAHDKVSEQNYNKGHTGKNLFREG